MKINDIDYDEYQRLVAKAKAFDEGLAGKFFKIPYDFRVKEDGELYISRSEVDLLNYFKHLLETKNYYEMRADELEGAIKMYCIKNKMEISYFLEKYKSF